MFMMKMVLVASIENDVVDESVMVNGLAAYVTEEGEKYVHIPNDANYYFEVEATGEGAMDYVVSELDEDGEVERQVATYDVPLDLGKQYHGTLEAGSNEADSCALVDEPVNQFPSIPNIKRAKRPNLSLAYRWRAKATLGEMR